MYRLDSEIIAISRPVSGWIGTGAMRPCSTARDSHSASRFEPCRATSAIGTTRFDLDQINEALAASFPATGTSVGTGAGPLPEPLGELAADIRVPSYRRELRRLLDAADLDQPVLIDAGTAVRMVRPYSWLLGHAGAGGIRLTGAGYLPPAHVEAAVAELGLGEEWIGKGNREVQTAPVLHLRESATRMGLLRKHHGMLLTTSRGRALCHDPAGLWWHLAERMPPRSADRCEMQAGLLLLAAVAARFSGDLDGCAAGRASPPGRGGPVAGQARLPAARCWCWGIRPG